MDRSTTKLFVYGTLKRGQYFHDKLERVGATFSGIAYINRDFSLYIDIFPMLVRESSDRSVEGELYIVPSELLKDLDGIEGNSREIISVVDESGVPHKAWAYVHPKSAINGAFKDYVWN